MRLETVRGPLSESWNMLRTSYMEIFKGIVKIELLDFVVVLIGILAALGAALALYGISPLVAIFVAIAIFISGLFAGAIVNSLNYNFIDAVATKRKFFFAETARRNALPVIIYTLLRLILYAIILGPLFIIFIFVILSSQDSSGLLVRLAEFLFRVLIAFLGAVIYLFIQFTVFELLIGRRGALESFGESFRMVRRNFFETILFSLILWGVETAVSLPFIALIVLLLFSGILSSLALGTLSLVVWLIVGILLILLAVVLTAISLAVTTTSQYKFWMRVKRSF